MKAKTTMMIINTRGWKQ